MLKKITLMLAVLSLLPLSWITASYAQPIGNNGYRISNLTYNYSCPTCNRCTSCRAPLRINVCHCQCGRPICSPCRVVCNRPVCYCQIQTSYSAPKWCKRCIIKECRKKCSRPPVYPWEPQDCHTQLKRSPC